jgi:hypothetical protein
VLQVLGTWKSYQQEPFCLKDRSVLLAIDQVKNALWSCVVEIHVEIPNCDLQCLGWGWGPPRKNSLFKVV